MNPTEGFTTYSLASGSWVLMGFGVVALAGAIAAMALIGPGLPGYFLLAIFICSLAGYRLMSRSRLDLDADGLYVFQPPFSGGLRLAWHELEHIERPNHMLMGDIILIHPRPDIDWRQRLSGFALPASWFDRSIMGIDGLVIRRTELGNRYDEAFTALIAGFDRSRREQATKP